MKLIRCTPTRGENGENSYTNEVEMISDDLSKLKSKANELYQNMGMKPEPWCSRYPIMGNAGIKSDNEWVMRLSNQIGFIIEKNNL